MKYPRPFLIIILLLALPLLAAAPTSQLSPQSSALSTPFTPIDPFTQTKLMRRGVNILGADPIWQNFSRARFKEKHFQTIADGGFQTVRVNLAAIRHMNNQNQLDPAWLTTLDWVIQNALAAHLTVIIDEHDYNPLSTNLATNKPKLLAFWQQIAPRYKDAPNSVLFEILNEPHDQLDAKTWNALIAETLPIIRSTNPTRNVIIGPTQWNSFDKLDSLELPDADQHLIATFHYYAPMKFTHQGASWVKDSNQNLGTTWGTPADIKILTDNFAAVQKWSTTHHRPILLGEFGAYDKGDIDSRVKYTSTVARTAEQNNFAWTYWQFDGDFIVYDIKKDTWVTPVHNALIPTTQGNQ